MKSSLFVVISSVFFMTWLAVSYVTTLKPEPRLGRGSLPLSAKTKVTVEPTADSVEEQPIMAEVRE
jgi:hypothetical protein